MYFVLAAVGLFTLLVGASVRLRRPRRSGDAPFLLAVRRVLRRLQFLVQWSAGSAGLGVLLGRRDRVRVVAAAAAALHAGVSRSAGRGRGAARRRSSPLMYLPALALAPARSWPSSRGSRVAVGPLSRARWTCSIAPNRSICSSARRRRSRACPRVRPDHVAHRPASTALDCVGDALGVGPFAFGYALPWALGADPPLALQLTAIPLGLVPLTFACAIVRYRLRDVEVIIKRGACLTGIPRRQRRAVLRAAQGCRLCFSSDTDPTTGSSRCWRPRSSSCWRQPVKESIQNALDRVFYATATTIAAPSSASRAI